MRITTISRRAFAGLASVALLGFAGGCARSTMPVAVDAGPEENGVYAVLAEGSTPAEAQVDHAGALILPVDKKHADPESDAPVTYVAIDPARFVPMILEGAPDARKDDGGKTILSVTLKKDYIQPLEELTKAQQGGKIAVILDGDVITVHKVRSVISGGQFQVSRCTDNACEILRAKLVDDAPAGAQGG